MGCSDDCVVEVGAEEPWKEACVHISKLGVQNIQMEQMKKLAFGGGPGGTIC